MNTQDKYFWITNHPAIGIKETEAVIELTPNMVDPELNAVNLEDMSKNTKLEWWIEVSAYETEEDIGKIRTHYWALDCGGDTAEQAIDNLYELVWEHYGEY